MRAGGKKKRERERLGLHNTVLETKIGWIICGTMICRLTTVVLIYYMNLACKNLVDHYMAIK